jgi:hypothetical protein
MTLACIATRHSQVAFCEASGCLSFTRQNQSRHLAATSSDKKILSLDLMPFIGCFGRVQDERLKTAVAIQAVPNVTDALIAPVLGPFGGYQLITALNETEKDKQIKLGSWHPNRTGALPFVDEKPEADYC